MINFTTWLINIPIGTIVGIIAYNALANHEELFGPGRLKHKELVKEMKYRRKMERLR